MTENCENRCNKRLINIDNCHLKIFLYFENIKLEDILPTLWTLSNYRKEKYFYVYYCESEGSFKTKRLDNIAVEECGCGSRQ